MQAYEVWERWGGYGDRENIIAHYADPDTAWYRNPTLEPAPEPRVARSSNVVELFKNWWKAA